MGLGNTVQSDLIDDRWKPCMHQSSGTTGREVRPMNCPLHWTDAPGISADSVVSGNPASPNSAGRSGFVGERIYRLTETTPTA